MVEIMATSAVLNCLVPAVLCRHKPDAVRSRQVPELLSNSTERFRVQPGADSLSAPFQLDSCWNDFPGRVAGFFQVLSGKCEMPRKASSIRTVRKETLKRDSRKRSISLFRNWKLFCVAQTLICHHTTDCFVRFPPQIRVADNKCHPESFTGSPLQVDGKFVQTDLLLVVATRQNTFGNQQECLQWHQKEWFLTGQQSIAAVIFLTRPFSSCTCLPWSCPWPLTKLPPLKWTVPDPAWTSGLTPSLKVHIQ